MFARDHLSLMITILKNYYSRIDADFHPTENRCSDHSEMLLFLSKFIGIRICVRERVMYYICITY